MGLSYTEKEGQNELTGQFKLLSSVLLNTGHSHHNLTRGKIKGQKTTIPKKLACQG